MQHEHQKNVGIWMDHSRANLIESSGTNGTRTIESKFTPEVKQSTWDISEFTMHNKENQQQAEYYKKIGAAMLNYDQVLLFGPTEAKQQLFNLLKKDHRFDKIRITVQDTDKMTENQQHAFVRNYFKE